MRRVSLLVLELARDTDAVADDLVRGVASRRPEHDPVEVVLDRDDTVVGAAERHRFPVGQPHTREVRKAHDAAAKGNPAPQPLAKDEVKRDKHAKHHAEDARAERQPLCERRGGRWQAPSPMQEGEA